MKPISLKQWRERTYRHVGKCPFCRGGIKIEMFYSGRCPACLSTGRIEPIEWRPAK